MRVSEYYTLGLTQPSLDFVDVRLDTDVPLFIDPTALYLLDTEWGQWCRGLINGYFTLVLDCIKDGKHKEAQALLAQLSEPNETHLGLSTGKSQGHGMGKDLAKRMWFALKESQAVTTGLIQDLEDTVLMIEGIDKDIISDIVTNIIREPLTKYTEDMCRQYGIPLNEGVASKPVWNGRLKKWDTSQFVSLPTPNNERLMLVPKAIVRRDMSYDDDKYYNTYLLEKLQNERWDEGIVRTLKNGEPRLVYKKDIKEEYSALSVDGKVNVKEQNRSLTPDRLEVLEKYKVDTKNSPKPALKHEQIADTTQTPPPDWDGLLNNLISLPTGRDDAKKYEKAVQALFEALFSPWLMYPRPQARLHNGRKIVDIEYSNMADSDFFKWLKDTKPSSYIFVECKNYSTQVGNPELDQLSGRFSPSRGKVGILVSRSVEDRASLTQSCRDTAQDDRGYIIALDDNDLRQLVDDIRHKPDNEKLDLLRERFRELV